MLQSKSRVRSKDTETHSRSQVTSWETRIRGAPNRVDPIGPRMGQLSLPAQHAVARVIQSQQCSPSSQGHPKGVSSPPTLLLRSFSCSAPTWQAVPTETKPPQQGIQGLSLGTCLLYSFRRASTPRSPLSLCRIQMNLRKSLNYNPTLLI